MGKWAAIFKLVEVLAFSLRGDVPAETLLKRTQGALAQNIEAMRIAEHRGEPAKQRELASSNEALIMDALAALIIRAEQQLAARELTACEHTIAALEQALAKLSAYFELSEQFAKLEALKAALARAKLPL